MTLQSLNSKQRQLRKSGNELQPNDAAELRRVSAEQQALQKHLEAARKQSRQHSMLIQVRSFFYFLSDLKNIYILNIFLRLFTAKLSTTDERQIYKIIFKIRKIPNIKNTQLQKNVLLKWSSFRNMKQNTVNRILN